MKPEVLLRSSKSPAKSLSEYAIISVLSPFLYKMPSSVVPFKYLNIGFAANQCDSVGEDMNLLIKLTPYIRSGRVAVKYIRLPTTYLNMVESTLVPTSSFDSFVPETMGFLLHYYSPCQTLLEPHEHIFFDI
ncbi:hypothetical protein Fmac_032657 [Flemingia macrophylla]|uniref:Uncharacterized protein n=1 Tax=Flemingia macrophylla TaxID=520843 RepID=A0ABD1L5K9_9FABA